MKTNKEKTKIKERSKKADAKQKNILEMLKSHGAKIYDELVVFVFINFLKLENFSWQFKGNRSCCTR